MELAMGAAHGLDGFLLSARFLGAKNRTFADENRSVVATTAMGDTAI
jgi:hypothetical protein